MKMMKYFVLATLAFLPRALMAQEKPDKAYGEYLAQECVTCHRADGQMKGIPPIVGYPQEAFIQFMNEYRDKKRTNSQMQAIATRLSDKDIAALAAFYETQVAK